MKKKNNNR